jgi:hypothetical protein
MKKIILCAFFITFSLYARAQSNCEGKNYSANDLRKVIRDIQTLANDKLKSEDTYKLAKEGCFTAEQVKEIANIFTTDADKYNFLLEAFGRTIDKENFYTVYDALNSFSVVFRLHDNTLNKNASVAKPLTETTPQKTVAKSVILPVKTKKIDGIEYPETDEYKGMTKCNEVMKTNDFQNYYNYVEKEKEETLRAGDIYQTSFKACFSTTQVMMLVASFRDERKKLDLLKKCFTKVYDIESYHYTTQLLRDNAMKTDLIAYIQENMPKSVVTKTTPMTATEEESRQEQIPIDCKIDATEYEKIKSALATHSFDNTRLNLARTIITHQKCISTEQLKGIANLFFQEDNKLELVKFSYSFVSDKEEIKKLSTYFSTPDTKAGFEKFIAKQ